MVKFYLLPSYPVIGYSDTLKWACLPKTMPHPVQKIQGFGKIFINVKKLNPLHLSMLRTVYDANCPYVLMANSNAKGRHQRLL